MIAGKFLLKASAELHPALVVFSDHIIDTINFSRPPTEIVMRLANLQEGRGGTALFDALMYSAKLLRPSMPGDAIYLISDGGENASQRLREVKRELLASGIRMFAFRLTDKYFRAVTSEQQTLLEDLTRA